MVPVTNSYFTILRYEFLDTLYGRYVSYTFTFGGIK